MAVERTARDYALLWAAFSENILSMGKAAQERMLGAQGTSINEFAKNALQAQGRVLAFQEIIELLAELERAEADGSLGAAAEEEVDDDGRGTGRTEGRNQAQRRRE